MQASSPATLPHTEHEALLDVLHLHFQLSGTLAPLAGYENPNYRLTTPDGKRFVVKLYQADTDQGMLEAQDRLLQLLAQSPVHEQFPLVIPSVHHLSTFPVRLSGTSYFIRVLSWLEGTPMALETASIAIMGQLGQLLAHIHLVTGDTTFPAIQARQYEWDLKYALRAGPYLSDIPDAEIRRLCTYFLHQFETFVLPQYPFLPQAILHNDANDYNVLVKEGAVSGLLDFGDTVYGPRIQDLAIALAYGLMGQEEPIPFAAEMVRAYQEIIPLGREEIALIYPMVGARLAFSRAKGARTALLDPENAYWQVSQPPVKALLKKWIGLNPQRFENALLTAAGHQVAPPPQKEDLLRRRHNHISDALSISYETPIHMVKAAMQYMYDAAGRTYLDCVNNICHIGHCHPHVVKALQWQGAQLNTNTRYLYEPLNAYAEALAATFPDPLEVVFFTNSGSEAGDLAQRIARTVTGEQDMIVLEHGYHGNTLAGISISHYKYDGKGGQGPEAHIHDLPMPDPLRGPFAKDPEAGAKYAQSVVAALERLKAEGKGPAAFYAESILGCGGQVVLPPGYLKGIYEKVRAAGGLCVADEVQVGFGRVGTHFWGFETHGVVPDIVVLGKPIGNGHPLAAVVTTREIARRFHTGMEYFNSFGGNPVSCAVGMAVLRTLQEDRLQQHAQRVGDYLMDQLRNLQSTCPSIGDVRGAGLFIGVELITDPYSMAPDASLASTLVNAARQQEILLSTDGPYHNVIKIKPPLVFNRENADQVAGFFRQFLEVL